MRRAVIAVRSLFFPSHRLATFSGFFPVARVHQVLRFFRSHRPAALSTAKTHPDTTPARAACCSCYKGAFAPEPHLMRTFVTAVVTAVVAAASVVAAIAFVPAPAGDDPTKPIPWSCAPGAACDNAVELSAPAGVAVSAL
jgi:hypothetical protein